MKRRLPNNIFSEHLQVQMFYDRLTLQSRAQIDSSAGGSLHTKTVEEAQDLIELVANNQYLYSTPSERDTIKKGVMEAEAIDTLKPLELEIALQKLTLSTTTFIDGTNNFMNETKAILKNQEASIRNLEVQVGQIASQLTEKSPNTFPSNTITNPKEECKVIQLRSGKKVEKKIEESAENSSQIQQEKKEVTPSKAAEPIVKKPAEKRHQNRILQQQKFPSLKG
ncbi:hypothetical protein PIB30_024467 [Stylosanthes scabra]|uniref:Uncharacterized protein n=1 Tax=Stylosanthes scabra TaxID=79078 RepID=A0ABU6X9H7_9FABA|nr:hypothetical protein [Stylosanthes scabra]